MKHIPLRVVTIDNNGETISLSYRAQIAEIIRHPGEVVDLEEVRRALRVLLALDQAPPEATGLNLEDADFEYMKARILNARWPLVDQAILDFVEATTLTGGKHAP